MILSENHFTKTNQWCNIKTDIQSGSFLLTAKALEGEIYKI